GRKTNSLLTNRYCGWGVLLFDGAGVGVCETGVGLSVGLDAVGRGDGLDGIGACDTGVGFSVGLDGIGFDDGLVGAGEGVDGLVCETGVGFSDGLDGIGFDDGRDGVIAECK